MIQELQISPMGVIEMIYPKNNETNARLGINIFQEVCRAAAGPGMGNAAAACTVGNWLEQQLRRGGASCEQQRIVKYGIGSCTSSLTPCDRRARNPLF